MNETILTAVIVLLLADRPTSAAAVAQPSNVSELYEVEDPRPVKKRKPQPVEDVLDYDRPSEVDYEEELELNRREDLEPKRRRTAADTVAAQGQLAYA